MSQYGKAEYWEDRYNRYVIPHAETLSPLTGTNASVASRISSLPTWTRATRS
jgi:hypothetical protein